MRAAFFNAETQSRRERLFPLRLCASALYSPLRLCVSALFISIAAHAAPVEYRWHANSERTAAPDIPVWQGETVLLIPAFRARAAAADLSGDTFALYWQTNGMGTAWWSVPAAAGTETGTVVATWSPTNDVGARAYTFFIASTSSSGTSYRAHGRLLMRPAPGATPSVLAAPTTLTDAMQAWADARYDPIGAAQTASNALANGAALGATALQAPATNTLAAAAAHAGTEHSVTAGGGFQGGASATDYGGGGGAVGNTAGARSGGGAVGLGAQSVNGGGAIGNSASAAEGGAVGFDAKSGSGFAGGFAAHATTDGTWHTEGIDAVQLGTGGNSTPLTLQIYANRLLNADGTIPVERMSLHAADGSAHADIREAIDAATNALAGNIMGGDLPVQRWKMFDFGVSSNRWLILTNDVLEIWEQ